MSRIAVVLFNLGGPDSPRGGRAVSLQSVHRSGDHRAAQSAALAGGAADRAAARAGGAADLCPDRQCLAAPRQHRGAGAALEQALGPAFRSLHRHALLAPAEPRRRRRGEGLAAGRGRAAAALSAILEHDDASSLAAWRAAAAKVGLDGADPRGVLLSGRDRASSPRSPRGSRPRSPLAEPGTPCAILLSAHGLPQRIVARGDPYQCAGRGDRRRAARGGSAAASSNAWSATRAGSGRSHGSSRRPMPRSAAPAPTASALIVAADRLRLRAFGNPGRARHRLRQLARERRRAALCPRRRRSARDPAFHRRARRAGAGRAGARRGAIASRRRTAALPAGFALCPCTAAGRERADGALSLAQGAAHPQRRRLDGRAALSAAALRLPRRRAAGSERPRPSR